MACACAFAQWFTTLLEQLVSRTLDAAVVLLPDGGAPPGSVEGEGLGTETFSFVAAKFSHLPRSNPHGCGVFQGRNVEVVPYKILPFAVTAVQQAVSSRLQLFTNQVLAGTKVEVVA